MSICFLDYIFLQAMEIFSNTLIVYKLLCPVFVSLSTHWAHLYTSNRLKPSLTYPCERFFTRWMQFDEDFLGVFIVLSVYRPLVICMEICQ